MAVGFLSTMKLDLASPVVFQERSLPPVTRLAGWSALVQALGVSAPVRHPSCVSEHYVSGRRREEGGWTVLDKRYWPGESLADHLIFALRHEDLDLLILKRVFNAVPPTELESLVRAEATSIPLRRAWYLYEFLTARTLDVDDAPRAAVIDLLDPKAYFMPNRVRLDGIVYAIIPWGQRASVRSYAGPRLWKIRSPLISLQRHERRRAHWRISRCARREFPSAC